MKDKEKVRAYNKAYYLKNKERERARSLKYYYEHREEMNKKSLEYRYAHLEELREKDRKRRLPYEGKNKWRMLAHANVRWAKKTGRLVPKPCEICDNEKVEAHHDNYNEPLKVRWFCPVHHRQRHKNNKPIYPEEG